MSMGGKRPGAGRKVGSASPENKMLKEAILMAAAAVGEDGHGKGKLTGYLKARAKDQPVAFMGLLGKVIPLQVTGADGKGLKIEIVEYRGG